MKIIFPILIAVLSGVAFAAPKVKVDENGHQLNPKLKLDKKFPLAFYHKPGFVISPFKPYNILNVKHLRPGQLARDPFTAVVDPRTGKRAMDTARIFRVPEPPKVKPTKVTKSD